MNEVHAPRAGRLAVLKSAAAAAVMVAGSMIVMTSPAAAEGQILNVGGPNAIKDSYIVVLKDSAVDAAAQTGTLADKYGAKVEHTYLHALRGFAGTMTERVAKRLAADPAVAYVEQNGTVQLAGRGTQFNPPSWGLDRIDQRNLPLDGRYTYPNTAPNVRAYVIDTGIRVTHQDFGGRAVWGTNTTGDGNNTDCNGHGTHVAGTIGGAAHGVAKEIQLTAVKVLGCGGSGTWAGVTAGVDWVTGDHASGPAVANMSLGGSAGDHTVALENAVRNSIADGVVYAIAAGNSNSDACNFSPARVLEAITVNSTDINDARASFSNYGTCTDIFAPGVSITSAYHTSDTATAVLSGTSMAAPHVAGAAALIMSEDPSASPAQVADAIFANSTPGLIPNPGPGSPNRLLFVNTPSPSGSDHLVPGQSLQPDEFLRSQNGLYTLIMQTDGNLVLYDEAGQPLWYTDTWGNPEAFAAFQRDGNFVVYTKHGQPLWYTDTWGTGASIFLVQDDSNTVIYGPSGEVYWHRWQ